MIKRAIVILNGHKEREEYLSEIYLNCKHSQNDIYVASKNKTIIDVKHIDISNSKNIPSAKNIIIDYITKLNEYNYLYIIEDDVIINDNKYFNNIEELMKLLKLNYWFNTSTNPLNHIFYKYSPRLKIDLGKYQNDIIKDIWFCAHDSTECMVWDLKYDVEKFNEEFNLFYNIEYIKRLIINENDHTIKYLNFWPTFNNESDFIYRIAKLPHTNVMKNRESIISENEKLSNLIGVWKPHNMVDDIIDWLEQRIIKNA